MCRDTIKVVKLPKGYKPKPIIAKIVGDSGCVYSGKYYKVDFNTNSILPKLEYSQKIDSFKGYIY